MHLDDTIVAIATPPGRGGIGVVRLAGPEACTIALSMLRLKSELEPGRACVAELIEPARQHPDHQATATAVARLQSLIPPNPAEAIDEVVVTYFRKPHSYTADDIVEISAHGAPVILRHMVELATERGARVAEPGEFTMRAFLNGRIDLTQAEAVRDLVESQTLYQAKIAAQQLHGALSHRLQPVKQGLIDLIARLEAGIDFAEDDVAVLPGQEILKQMAGILSPLEQLNNSFVYGKIVREGLTLAIVGRPNVGKSSLFNRLVERERAIVTSTPGTTRDLVTETVSLGGIPLELVDTAGLRHALDEAETIGIRKSLEVLEEADLVLVVLDHSQPVTGEDEQWFERVRDRAVILVENKADLPSAARNSDKSLGCEALPRVRTSALRGDGIDELRAAILRQISGDKAATLESGFLTSTRHQALVADAVRALEAAQKAVYDQLPHEMLLLDLYNALRALDEMTGATTTDDILNLIFSRFCIGK
ncbi:MAG: tRNA uridine-5-carboxymethylaminomethyl(34) synthesis GTPase MnmE [Acidobacteria bacterium]|nr:tRNA uridine-5-carboxymethylaminomethyl(34) synthesis GTPase MnmE [Acidobacteriota bacterium]